MIKIRLKDLEDIISHCKKELPLEACGILAGRIEHLDGEASKEVIKVYKCTNELDSSTEYRIKAEDQFKIFIKIGNRS